MVDKKRLALVILNFLLLTCGHCFAQSAQAEGDAARGDVLVQKADFGKAEVAFRSALSTDPQNAQAHQGIGTVEEFYYFNMPKAIDEFQKAAAIYEYQLVAHSSDA